MFEAGELQNSAFLDSECMKRDVIRNHLLGVEKEFRAFWRRTDKYLKERGKRSRMGMSKLAEPDTADQYHQDL